MKKHIKGFIFGFLFVLLIPFIVFIIIGYALDRIVYEITIKIERW